MENWKNKIVVMAGGSKGLGFAIAREFAGRGADIVLLARNESRLKEAVDELKAEANVRIEGVSVDLTDEKAVQAVVEKIVGERGGLDAWVNAVGQSIRTGFLDCSLATYRQLMEQNFFASVIGSLAALPWLQKRNGHLVNIGSLAAKTAWPLVSPYVTSKHALAGFTHQLRLEGPPEVHYLWVCPGPIASATAKPRYQEQAEGLPDAASKPGAGAPVRLIDPQELATKIVNACEQRKLEMVIPFKSRILFSLLQLWPSLGDRLIRRFCK